MPNPVAIRVFDTVLGFLLRPRIRRLRHWSFLVTVPVGFLLARSFGLSFGDGFWLGAVAAVLDAAVVMGAAVAGARLLGPERRDALLDLLMHPFARRAIVSEARMLATLPLALLGRLRLRGGRLRRLGDDEGQEFACHRGSHELGAALALTPPVIAEGVVAHLLLPDAWLWPKVGLAALSAYGLVMLLSWAIAPRISPHRVHNGLLDLRGGRLYRARVSAADVSAVTFTRRREGRLTGLTLDAGGAARLAVGGRTDVLLRFAAPVGIERPLGDPVAVTELSIAVDDPAAFVVAVEAARRTPPPAGATSRRELFSWLVPAGLADDLA